LPALTLRSAESSYLHPSSWVVLLPVLTLEMWTRGKPRRRVGSKMSVRDPK